jgi:hypothetical protein
VQRVDNSLIARYADGGAIRAGQRVRPVSEFRNDAHDVLYFLLRRVGFHNDQHTNLQCGYKTVMSDWGTSDKRRAISCEFKLVTRHLSLF